MRALTLWRPWDEPVACGTKPVENRSWAPPSSIRGAWIAIHAGKKYDAGGAAFIMQRGFSLLPRAASDSRSGCVVAVVRLAGAFHQTAPEPIWHDPTWQAVLLSPWFCGPWGWLFDRAVSLRPIPCRGAQGLWILPSDVERLVRAELRGPP